MNSEQIDGLYFHEDRYCMWQILPAANIEFIKKQCAEAEAFSQEHLDEDGNFDGTDIMVLEEEPVTIATLNLKSETVKNLLKAIMQEQTNIYIDAEEDVILCDNIKAYGESEDCAFLLEESDGIVTNLALLVVDPTDSERKKLLQAFDGLSKMADFIFVDWYWHEFYALNDTINIKKYLDAKREHFLKVMQEIESEEEQ